CDPVFLCGYGFFETMVVYNDKPFRWSQHFARLERGAEFLQMSIPGSCGELLRQAHDLIGVNEMSEGLLRVTLSRGIGLRGYSLRGANRPTLVMTTYPT